MALPKPTKKYNVDKDFYVPPVMDDPNNKNNELIQTQFLKLKELSDELEDKVNKLQPLPIGFCMWLDSDSNPSQLIGYGVWEKISGGYTLVSEGGEYVRGSVGGSKTATLTNDNIAPHNHNVTAEEYTETKTLTNNDTKTTAEGGTHEHSIRTYLKGVQTTETPAAPQGYVTTGTSSVLKDTLEAGIHTHDVSISHTHTFDINHTHTLTQDTIGKAEPFNIESPYLVMSLWKRTN